MSKKYKDSSEVPMEILTSRLTELWRAIIEGREGINREFFMRIPAEVDYDADIVICEASQRLKQLEAENAALRAFKNFAIDEMIEYQGREIPNSCGPREYIHFQSLEEDNEQGEQH